MAESKLRVEPVSCPYLVPTPASLGLVPSLGFSRHRRISTEKKDKIRRGLEFVGPKLNMASTDPLVHRLAGPSSGKAGLARDQTEINRVIAETSKGSKYYEVGILQASSDI